MARGSVRTMALGEYSGEALRRQRVQNLLLTENRFPPGLQIGEHSHSYPHFTIMLEGSFTERYQSIELVCEKGDILIVPEAQPHTDTIGDNGAHSLSIEVSRSLVKFLSIESDFLASPKVSRDRRHTPSVRALKRLFIAPLPPSAFELHAAAMQVILSVFRAASGPEVRSTNQPSWLSAVIRSIESDLVHAPSLSELAKIAHISPAHLSRAFRKATGQTVGEFLRSARLTFAVQQLESSSESIATIAAEAGFFDQSHFTRQFKQAYDVTPSEYRGNII